MWTVQNSSAIAGIQCALPMVETEREIWATCQRCPIERTGLWAKQSSPEEKQSSGDPGPPWLLFGAFPARNTVRGSGEKTTLGGTW